MSRREMCSHSNRHFTGEELGQLNQRHNTHVAYAGKVYDVSGFLEKHPGGCDQLMLGAGRDITQLFHSYHKPETAKLIEGKCKYAGELVDNEMPSFLLNEGEFLSALRTRVNDYFRLNNLDPKFDVLTFFRYTAFAVLAILSWYMCVVCHDGSWLLGALFAGVSGFLCAMIAVTIGHDGSHFAITHKPWVWKISTTLGFSIFGLSSLSWTYQHTYGHHVYTNIDGSDPDVKTVNERLDYWRIKPFQSWFPTYRFQHIYMPFLYSFLAIKMKLQDFHTIFIMRKANIRINPLSTYQFVAFFAEKVLHVLYRFLIPLLYMPLPSLLTVNLIADVVMGLWLAMTQLNHVNTKVSWPSPEQSKSSQPYERNWAEMQIASTVDYATESWFWTVFTGALNHQVAHHLFPGVLQTYYPQITPIVKKTCAEFDLCYYELPSIWDALCCHLGYLKVMGAAPRPQTKG